ncbi:hypothetical protein V1264_014771 [Littorina saxatilis]|uniref:Uncharacterized protein n=1 Tax=Littorina saxatilis TaxID=31220 RepID=A0AAN9BSU1_9CAEN
MLMIKDMFLDYCLNEVHIVSLRVTDPVSYAEGVLKLRSGHRVELANLENQMDEEHAKQLSEMREKVAETGQEKLREAERETIQKLQDEGMTEKMVATLMKKHEAEKESLRNTQEKNKRNQDDKLKEELARRRREFAERRERERQEQEDLREHEADVMKKLVNSQVSMSEAERDRIMKEHEKQMVLLENSLTLNKLRQQRSLEERLNQKRAQQMSRLQTQQQSELVKQRKKAENNGEEDDEETHRAALELMKKHVKQRIAVMQGDQLNIDEELEEIRMEMMKDRALALRGQEERLGAMISALQMEKAREMTQIEQQQKAINNLKAKMMDDLNERGILSTPECERILDVHKQESETLNQKLDQQRTKQEQILRAKLEERLEQRQQQILAKQDTEMQSVMQTAGNKFSIKVRRVMLSHKHMVEMEKFKNRMDREITQSLADIKRQFEVTKMQRLQKQELEFVAGLVRVGCFQENELLDVLHMLFPGKTEEDIQRLLLTITAGTQKPADKDPKKLKQRDSQIVDKIYQAQYSNGSLLNRSGSVRSSSGKKKKLSKKGSRASMNALGTLNEPGYTQDYGMNDAGVGTYNQRTRARNSVTGYNNSAYDDYDDYSNRNGRNSISGNYGNDYDDHYDRRQNARRYSDDDNSRYNEGVDFIAMGASMTQKDVQTGRLPPLEDQELPAKRKKKKKGLLKKHRQQQDQDW